MVVVCPFTLNHNDLNDVQLCICVRWFMGCGALLLVTVRWEPRCADLCAGALEEDEEECPGDLGEQYARARQTGSAAASGGCTDAGVRLGSLLSVSTLHYVPVP